MTQTWSYTCSPLVSDRSSLVATASPYPGPDSMEAERAESWSGQEQGALKQRPLCFWNAATRDWFFWGRLPSLLKYKLLEKSEPVKSYQLQVNEHGD